MTINYPQNLKLLSAFFAVYRPKQMAFLAGLMSLFFHVGVWQAWPNGALKTESLTSSHRFEVALMAPVLPAAPVKIENSLAKAIPKPVTKSVPIVKPTPKLARKTKKSATQKIKPPIAKPIMDTGPSIATKITTDVGSAVSVHGNRIAAQTNPSTQSGMGKGINSNSGYIEANFKANYAVNPKPIYPDIAKSRGWQGTVLLRVKVTAGGRSEEVAVHRSSGYKMLDQSAITAVKNWRFIPAKRDDTPVACTVIVPIVFALG